MRVKIGTGGRGRWGGGKNPTKTGGSEDHAFLKLGRLAPENRRFRRITLFKNWLFERFVFSVEFCSMHFQAALLRHFEA